jgi:hypothetical protein
VRTLRHGRALSAYLARIDAALDQLPADRSNLSALSGPLRRVREDLAGDAARAAAGGSAPPDESACIQAAARALTLRMAYLLAAAELIEQATFDAARGDQRGALVAELWIRRRLLADPATGEAHRCFPVLLES